MSKRLALGLGAALAVASLAPAALPAAAAQVGPPYWKVVGYWPKTAISTGCVGLLYQRRDLPGYFTRTAVVFADGSEAISSRLPKAPPGAATRAAAIAAEKARHFAPAGIETLGRKRCW